MGCDGILNSPVRLDKCRVCGGNNTTCERNKGDLKKTPTSREKFEGKGRIIFCEGGGGSEDFMEGGHIFSELKKGGSRFFQRLILNIFLEKVCNIRN